jgi:hypothetical protein
VAPQTQTVFCIVVVAVGLGIAAWVDKPGLDPKRTDNGQKKTLYLWGQYLDELESSKQFPNTALEITRLPGHKEFIEFKVAGEYFKEEKTLPAFRKETVDPYSFRSPLITIAATTPPAK